MSDASLPIDVPATIRARSSWRSYEQRPIAAETRDRLLAAIAAPPTAPFGTELRLDLLESFDAQQRGVEKLGTYGVIRGASSYLVGVVAQGDHTLEDYGYVFEWALLVATELGLGTCWLGGTFQRGAFGQAVSCDEASVIPAVSPVGYPQQKRSLLDRTFRFAARSKKRLGWDQLFFTADGRSPLSPEAAADHAEVLELLRLGPSASNRQPWRVAADPAGRRFALYLKRSPAYRQRFTVDLQRVDMGIAMCHFELGATALGLTGTWSSERPEGIQAPAGAELVATWVGG